MWNSLFIPIPGRSFLPQRIPELSTWGLFFPPKVRPEDLFAGFPGLQRWQPQEATAFLGQLAKQGRWEQALAAARREKPQRLSGSKKGEAWGVPKKFLREIHVGAFCQGMLGLYSFLPTHGFSVLSH